MMMNPLAGGMPGMMPPQMGMPPPGPDPSMAALQSLGGMPNGAKEKKALATAKAHIQMAIVGLAMRSGEAVRHLGTAMKEVEAAEKVVEELGQAQVGPPPDLLGNMQSLSQGMPGAGAML